MISVIPIRLRPELVAIYSLLFLLMTSIVASSQEINGAAPTAVAKNVPGEPENSLSATESQYDFGVVHHMDNTQKMYDISQSIDLKHNLPGLKHIFTLSNDHEFDIEIDSLKSDCECTQGEIVENGEMKNLPYIVKSKSSVVIRMAFDYYDMEAGNANAHLYVSQTGKVKPLAVLSMVGTIKGGIEVSEKKIDFGKVVTKGRYKDIFINFDRRISQNMLPERVKLLTKNPYIHVENLDSGKNIIGVKVGVDTFQMPTGFKVLPKDFVLKIRLKLSEDIPVGPVKGEVRLLMVGFPYDEMTRDVKVPIQGEVLGHMTASPLEILSIPSKFIGQSYLATKIVLLPPIKSENLKVVSSDPLLSVSLTPFFKSPSFIQNSEPAPNGPSSQRGGSEKPSEDLYLEVTLNKNAPPGKFQAKITVNDKISGERIELPIFATVASPLRPKA